MGDVAPSRVRVAWKVGKVIESEIIPCLRCGKPYDRMRGDAHFCKDCAKAIDREEARNRARERVERAKLLIESTPSAAEWLPKLDEEKLEEIGLATENGDPSLVLDRPPPGALTPYGPEEGYSTFFEDLRGELKQLRSEAAEHPWWKANPHVFYEVHDAVKASVYLHRLAMSCGDKRGTRAGYLRHRRNNEMACPECAAANAERSREIRKGVSQLNSP